LFKSYFVYIDSYIKCFVLIYKFNEEALRIKSNFLHTNKSIFYTINLSLHTNKYTNKFFTYINKFLINSCKSLFGFLFVLKLFI